MGPHGRTELGRADFAFVFGNSFITEQLAETAADYYHQGYFERIVASGCGKLSYEYNLLRENPGQAPCPKTEAEKIAEKLEELGVPASALLLERSATNTQQNVENTKALMEREGLYPSTCIAFGHIKAGTRFLETTARRWPNLFTMAVGVNPFDVEISDWQDDPVFAEQVTIQHQSLDKYRKQGDAVPVDLGLINHIAATLEAPKQRREWLLEV